MLNPRTDLPHDRDSHGRFLPWIIAFVVFLASLALAGMLFLDSLAAQWERGVSATLSVQIPASGSETDDDRRTNAALIGLRASSGVVRADVVPAERIAALLEPWLGPATADRSCPHGRPRGTAGVDVNSASRRGRTCRGRRDAPRCSADPSLSLRRRRRSEDQAALQWSPSGGVAGHR